MNRYSDPAEACVNQEAVFVQLQARRSRFGRRPQSESAIHRALECMAIDRVMYRNAI